jgi:hypothetical protein
MTLEWSLDRRGSNWRCHSEMDRSWALACPSGTLGFNAQRKDDHLIGRSRSSQSILRNKRLNAAGQQLRLGWGFTLGKEIVDIKLRNLAL